MRCSDAPDIAPETFFEGDDLVELYRQNADPCFPATVVQAGDQGIAAFSGRVPMSAWLGIPLPMPSIPIWFMGSPVTDLFPPVIQHGRKAVDIVQATERAAATAGAWAVIVKDLPVGHFLEEPLAQEGFVPVEHDPIWYRKVPADLGEVLGQLSHGRRRGLKGRIRRFARDVRMRRAEAHDLQFVHTSYEHLRARSEMRLERLTAAFFFAALRHPACRMLIFEHEGAPFAFQMLWRNERVWFDKYIGTDDRISRTYSFYSMSLLHLLSEAAAEGIKWYVAGQGSGKDKAWLGFARIKVRLWIKPLALPRLAPALLARFSRMHDTRIYAEAGSGAE